jgi:hypothetical protein
MEPKSMTNSSRHNAQTWPYPRHRDFEEQLHQSNAAWFLEHSYSVNNRMPYLLEQWEDWPKNIILPEVAQFIWSEQSRCNEDKKPFPLHKYIHHGLSSQAMLFNLVGPLVVQNNLSPLKAAFENNQIAWPPEEVTPKFEVENRNIFNEDTGQPTSIDLAIQGKDGIRSLFIEAKLVEHEFGGCSVFNGGDCDGRNPAQDFERCYLHHLGRNYWTLMEKHGFLKGPAGCGPICPLAMYYQFFRELIFAIESGGDFVLLFDQRNPTFFCGEPPNERGLMPFLQSFVPEQINCRIHSISIQQVVATYQEYGNFSWLKEFEKKYNLISPGNGLTIHPPSRSSQLH